MGRTGPAHSPPSISVGITSSEMETQTDLIAVGREIPVVSFLSDDECILKASDIPNCYHFASSKHFVRSPRIPVAIQEVRVPMTIDTGAEVSLVSTKFIQDLFPGQELPVKSRSVRALGGGLINIRGPLTLKVEICSLVLQHPFYFYDSCDTFLLGFDLVTAAALIIDSANCCVWSRHTQDVQVIANCPHVDVTETSYDRGAPHSSCSIASESHGPQGMSGTVPDNSPRTGSRSFVSVEGARPIDDSSETLESSSASSNDTESFDQTLLKTAVSPFDASCSDESHGVAQGSDFSPPVSSPVSDRELPEHVNVLFLHTIEDNHLPETVTRDLKTLLFDHQDTFAKSSTDLGFCPLLKHDIDTGDARPIRQSPRKPPLAAREAEDEILDEMLNSGVIEPSNSEWASPVCLVKKKDGSFRFCIDYRRVNAVSKKDAYPIPDIQDALDHLKGARHFATLDLIAGYWQISMTQRAKERSAFCTRRGLFQFTRMPFGLSGAPGSFCRLMSSVLRDQLWRICLCYLDDIVIFGRTPEELLERIRMVLDRLRQVGLKVKPSKCEFFKTEVKFLGHMVSSQGIEPLPEKLDTIRDWPVPRCLRDVRAFFGLASYYRKFVKDFATIAEPLTRLTKKFAKFEWSEEAQQAFDALKQALIEASFLTFPCPHAPCILDTDASDVAIGGVVSQMVDGEERPIAFFSRVMNSAQRGYCTTRRELLAVVSSLQHFRHYLLGAKVILRTDHHSLKWLKTFKRPEGILARWVETLAEFDIEIEHRPGRLHSNVDGMSRPFCKQCEGKTSKTPWVDELERADELTEPLGIRTLSFVPEISDAEMAELQAEDPDLGPVVQWLLDGENPPPDLVRSMSLDTRNLWAQVPAVHLLGNVLVRTVNQGQDVQLVLPLSIRRQLFDLTHAGNLAAHLGSQRTFLQLKTAYYWPGMRKDIEKWYRQCDTCARAKGPPTRRRGKLQKVITGAPLDIVAIDILSGLPTTENGMKYILVLTDYFTKWACAFALPDAEASTCMRAMYNGFFAQFGLPRQLHSDQGRNFESKLFQEFCALTGVRKSRTSSFHAQCDGQCERLNRSLLQMLRTTADENPASWPQRLPTVMAAYRMTVHKTTGITPNMAMLGREVLLPATLIARPPLEPTKVTVPFVSDLRDTLRAAHHKVRESTHKTARTQKIYYDNRVQSFSYEVGQKVWLFWPRPPIRQKFKKLTSQWTGPWVIEKFLSPIVVMIRLQSGRKVQTVHVDRLLPCNSAPPQSAETVQDRPEGGESLQPSEPPAPATENEPQTTPHTRPVRNRRRPTALEPYLVG